MIVVDASVLIAHFRDDDVHHSRAMRMMLNASEHQLAASSPTIAEVLVGPARAGRLAPVQLALRDLGIMEVPIPSGASGRLARIRAETGLKLPDSYVLLAAEDVRAVNVLTFDDRLDRCAQARLAPSPRPRPEG